MITVEITYPSDAPFTLHAVAPDEAMAVLAEVLELAHLQDVSRLQVRVMGGPTAASCRLPPLSPGTIGDPRR